MKISISFEQVYDRIVYSSIAHALFLLEHPFFDYEQSWDKQNYSFIADTSRGIVSFNKQSRIAVAAIRNESVDRMNLFANIPAIKCFQGAPEKILKLANDEALEYMYCMVGRKKKIMITTACWLTNDTLFSNDNQEKFIKYGGEFLMEVLFADSIREYWKESYEWDNNEIGKAELLFSLLKEGKNIINMKDILDNNYSSEGKEACVLSLKEIGFTVI